MFDLPLLAMELGEGIEPYSCCRWSKQLQPWKPVQQSLIILHCSVGMLQLRILESNQLFLAYEANEITVSLIRNYDRLLDTPDFQYELHTD